MRDYTSNYKIKQFTMNEIAPKYFPENVTNAYNIGMVGFSSDIMANSIEDMYNTIPILMNEMFPNIANLPETIYNYASLFQEEDLLATASEMNTILFVNVEDIKRYGVNNGSVSEFMIDSNTVIDVEGQEFILDYDIKVTIKPYKGDFIYTSSYVVDYNNGMSDIKNPYIKSQKINYNGTVYLALMIVVRRCEIHEHHEHLISNDKINVPIINFNYEEQLTNFEVFYKEDDSKEWVQLKKKILNSSPIKSPFCFYRLKNTNTVEVSFTTQEKYFKPKFNSEILIKFWTSNGADGNFPLYDVRTGDNIVVRPNGDKYEYNSNIPFFTIPQSESRNGKSAVTLEELKRIITDNFSTVLSYTTESDLQRYFNSFKYKYNQDVIFVKKRDDLFERLFSSFSLLKDKNNVYYKTNTLHLELVESDFDIQYEQSERRILKPGHIFEYRSENDKRFVTPVIGQDITSLGNEDEVYKYTNPFLMSVSKQGIVGYYLNSMDKQIALDYSHINSDSLVQFICNNVYIKRNALLGDDFYELKLIISATDTDIESPLVDENGNDTKRIKAKIMFEDKTGKEMCYVDTELSTFDRDTLTYEFTAKLKTDDYLTIAEKIRILNVKDLANGEEHVSMIPMRDLNINIHTFFRYENSRNSHKYSHLPDLNHYTLTNSYTLAKEKINLALPLNMLKSNSKYRKYVNDEKYYIDIKAVPLVRAYDIVNYERFMYMLEILDNQYKYMTDIMDKKTNNYSVDMKFFNSYGKSINFGVDDDLKELNQVNCNIRFKLATHMSSNTEELIRDMKIFIKEYFEDINNNSLTAIYISNLIQSLENTFREIKYLKFISMNGYDTTVQNIENKFIDMNNMTKEERLDFVPEFLNIELDDIQIELIN